jgi:maleate isomerase
MENQATRRVRLGMLTPSSNSVLEPAVATMLMGLPDVSAHFARFRVTEIALSEAARHRLEWNVGRLARLRPR